MPIREYACAPRPRRCRAWWYLLGLILITVSLWCLPTIADIGNPALSVLLFFFSLVSLTVALMLLSRCVLCRYIYRLVATEDGGFDFTVDEVRRFRSVCVCRVEAEAVRAIALQGRGKRRCCDFDWQVYGNRPVYLLTIADGEETVIARITPDATLAAMLDEQVRRGADFSICAREEE